MANLCEKCATTFDGEFVKCGVFCSLVVCLKCSGIHENSRADLRKNGHLVWMCNGCKIMISKARFSNALVSTNIANNTLIDSLKDSLRTEIRDSILQEVRNDLRANPIPVNVCATPVLPPRNGSSMRSATVSSAHLKRRREKPPVIDSITSRQPKLLCAVGTGAANSEFATQNSMPTTPSFWLYLSGIVPTATEESVSQLVRSQLGTDEVQLKKLIPKGREVRTLTFVSFKVGLSLELKDKALSSDTWPAGIRFRQFVDNTSEPFFPNPKLPRLEFNPKQPTPFATPI